MEDWYKWFLSGIGVTFFLMLIIFIKTRKKFVTGIRYFSRNDIAHEIGSIQERFINIKKTLYLSGSDCKYVAESCSCQIDSLLKRGVRVKILVVDPNSNVPEMMSKIDPMFESADVFKSSIIEALNRFKEWKKRYPDKFEYRLLPILPALGFFISDPSSKDGIVKIEIYTAKHWRPIDSRPHVVFSHRAKKWREYYIQQWDNYWALSEAKQP